MLSGNIENRPMGCNYCGSGPWNGRESTRKERTELITECTWVCGRCGMVINQGVIKREKINTK